MSEPKFDPRAWLAATAAYIFLAGLFCFAWLGDSAVITMEGIVADGARHMLRTGDWLVPHLYGEIYAYKPALTYWLAAASIAVHPEPDAFALRAPVAVTTLLAGAALLVLIGRVCGPGPGFWTAIAFISGAEVMHKTRTAQFDMPLAAGVAIAVAAACVNLARPRATLCVWLLGYAGVAAAVLAKGMPALMAFAPGLLLAAWLTGRFGRLFHWRHLVGVLLFVLMVGSVGLGMWHSAGYAAFEQAIGEGRARGVIWTWGDVGITLLKPVIILGLMLPWSVLLVFAVPGAWRAALPESTGRAVTSAWGFLLAGVAAFMSVPTHEARYYLPLAAPCAILCGAVAATSCGFVASRAARSLITFSAGAPALLALAAAVWPVYHTPAPALRGVMGLLGVGALAIVIASHRRVARVPADLAAPPRRTVPGHGLALLSGALCLWAVIVFVHMPARAGKRSQHEVAAAFAPHVPADETVWVDMRDDNSSLIFYLNRAAHAYRGGAVLPPDGSLVILLPGQRAEIENRDGASFESIAKARGGGVDFELARIRGPEIRSPRSPHEHPASFRALPGRSTTSP